MKDSVILTNEENHFIYMLHLVILNKYVDIHLHESPFIWSNKDQAVYVFLGIILLWLFFIYSKLLLILWNAVH